MQLAECKTLSLNLWTKDFLSCDPLRPFFFLASSQRNHIERDGEHIIALESEKEIRELAHKLQVAGKEASVFPCYSPLADTVVVMGANVAMMIFEGKIPFQKWLASIENDRLDLREAIAIAKHLLACQPDSIERSIELEILRRRVGVSEYRWNNEYLAAIKFELERQFSEKDATQADPLRLELLALMKQADPIKKIRERAKIASHYGISKGEIDFLCRTIDGETKTPKAQFHALDDFLSMESEEIDYLVPGLLPRGETVLCCGLPKSGKTLLAIDAGFAIATGESHFLGEAVQQGRVLLISVDESAQSTKAKLLKRGFRPRDAVNIAVMTAWDISQLDALEAKLEDFRPDLVIIDSLKRITVGREISENSAEFADILYTLKELIGRYGAAGILIHHNNKNQEATGVSKVRGSTAIAGAVWGIWQLDIPESDDESKNKPSKGKSKQKRFDPTNPNRIFTAICRDTEGALLNVRFNPENHSYAISESDEAARADRRTQEQVILDILAEASPRGLTGREIMSYSNLGRGIYSVLSRLVDKRLITQRQSTTDHRMTVYCLPAVKGTSPLPHCLSVCDQLSSNGNQGKDLEIDHKLITNQEELITKFCKNDQKSSDVINLNSDPVPLLVEIDHKNATERGGEGVPLAITEVNNPSIAHEQCNDVAADLQTEEAPETIAKRCCEAQIAFSFDEEVDALAMALADEGICPDKDELATIRRCYSPTSLNAACKRLSPERHAQIKQWVSELNAAAAVPQSIDFSTFPHSEARANESVRQCKAEVIKLAILNIKSYEDVVDLENDRHFTADELNWVLTNLLTKEQKRKIYSIMAQGQ